MRLIPLILLLILLPAPTGAQLHLGTVQDLTFYSTALERETTCRVYLPPGYDHDDSDTRYPVIITLHGATVSYEVYNFMLPIIDLLWLNKTIDPFILVMPDGLCPPFNGSFYTNSELYGRYEDLISDDIIHLVDSTFNTHGSREYRAIMGHSMGAYGAFKQLFRHPDRYCAIAAHSGPVHIEMLHMLLPAVRTENGDPPYDWRYTPGRGLTNLLFTMAGAFSPNPLSDRLVAFPLDEQGEVMDSVMRLWNPHNIAEMVRWYMPATELGIYFDCGSRDEYQLYLHNRALSDSLEHYGIRHTYVEHAGDHTSGLPFRIPVAFRFLDQQFKGQQTGGQTLSDRQKRIVRVFPNPTSGQIWYEPEKPAELTDIWLVDELGRKLQSFPPAKQPLDLSGYPDGSYTLLFHYSVGLGRHSVVLTR